MTYAVFVGKRLYGYADTKQTKDAVVKALRKAKWTHGKKIRAKKLRRLHH